MLSLTNELQLKCIHMMMEENCLIDGQKAKFPVSKMCTTIGSPAMPFSVSLVGRLWPETGCWLN